jgi:hypothetical protein
MFTLNDNNNNNNMKLSLAQRITSPHDLYSVSLDALVHAIKTRPDLIGATKQETPFYLPSGTFTKNNMEGCTEHTGLFCIDVDNVTDTTDTTKLAILQTDLAPHVVLIANSYTAPNFYILIKTDHTSTDPKLHQATYHAIIDKLSSYDLFNNNNKLDKVTSNINRARFLSHDPNLYYLPNATPLKISVTSLSTNQNVGSLSTNQNVDTISQYLSLAHSWATVKHGHFDPDVKGNRNAFIHHFASAANNLGIPKKLVTDYLVKHYRTYDRNDFGNVTAIDSAYKRTDQFGTYIIHSDRTMEERINHHINKKLAYLATLDEKKSLYLLDEINLLKDILDKATWKSE